MLAILKEQYEIAEMLGENGKVDKYYKNQNKEHVFRMAKRMGLKSV